MDVLDPDTREAVKIIASLARFDIGVIQTEAKYKFPPECSQEAMARIIVYTAVISRLLLSSPRFMDKMLAMKDWPTLVEMAQQYQNLFYQHPEHTTIELLIGFPES